MREGVRREGGHEKRGKREMKGKARREGRREKKERARREGRREEGLGRSQGEGRTKDVE